MYGDFVLLERKGHSAVRARRLPLGDTAGRSEAWLRDTLFQHPQILPIEDIEPSFGPLAPLCCELRTEVGSVDTVFICPNGRLTLVECKLWRNPEARRSVVAQILDYASAIKRWSYSDLQRQVTIASGRQGNLPYERARTCEPQLWEHDFVDAVSRNLRAARFLLIVAGDGIREDIGAMAELLRAEIGTRFTFALLEVALHDLGEGDVVIQPRLVAKTHIIERHVVLVHPNGSEEATGADDEALPVGDILVGRTPGRMRTDSERVEHERWWEPIVSITFDDPDQQRPRLYWKNNTRTPMPWPGIWLTTWTWGEKSPMAAAALHCPATKMKLMNYGAQCAAKERKFNPNSQMAVKWIRDHLASNSLAPILTFVMTMKNARG
jgi:hypothetical protein